MNGDPNCLTVRSRDILAVLGRPAQQRGLPRQPGSSLRPASRTSLLGPGVCHWLVDTNAGPCVCACTSVCGLQPAAP